MAFKLVQVISLSHKAKELNGSIVVEQLENSHFAIGIKYKNEAGMEASLYVPSKGAGSKKEFSTIAQVLKFCTDEGVKSFTVHSQGIVKTKTMTQAQKDAMKAGRAKLGKSKK